MTIQNRKKDDELLIWLIVGFIFTGTLIGVDIWYSSFHEMAKLYGWAVLFLHFILLAGWIGTLVKFYDPNYDWLRKFVCVLSIILVLMVGIHHATIVEDKQVIIDSHASTEIEQNYYVIPESRMFTITSHGREYLSTSYYKNLELPLLGGCIRETWTIDHKSNQWNYDIEQLNYEKLWFL